MNIRDKYGERDALITISAEKGEIEATLFAETLMRMYLRWAERHGYPIEVYEISYAEDAGIESVTFEVKSPSVYGILSTEHGTHSLTAISPCAKRECCQTSFVSVEVLPVTVPDDEIDIPETEIQIQTFRAPGPGAMPVSCMPESTVRLTHLPTDIISTCEKYRTPRQNLDKAKLILQSRLVARQQDPNPIDIHVRSYVSHPYPMVKDSCTGIKQDDLGAVFDGHIDEFLKKVASG